jgi:hypothetical protein
LHGVLQQPHDGAWGDKIISGKPGAVCEQGVSFGNPDGFQEIFHGPDARVCPAYTFLFARDRAEIQFGMQVEAHFVHYAYAF